MHQRKEFLILLIFIDGQCVYCRLYCRYYEGKRICAGSISSYDGFVRNLDDLSGSEYALNLLTELGTRCIRQGL